VESGGVPRGVAVIGELEVHSRDVGGFGTELERRMTARGLSVRGLARISGYSPGHISDLRSGRRAPSAEAACDLDDALGADGAVRLSAERAASAAARGEGRGEPAGGGVPLIRVERKRRGWAAAEMAGRLREVADDPDRMPHVQSLVRMIRQWEAGHKNPSERYRLLYCRVFGLSERELFGIGSAVAPGVVPGGGGGDVFLVVAVPRGARRVVVEFDGADAKAAGVVAVPGRLMLVGE